MVYFPDKNTTASGSTDTEPVEADGGDPVEADGGDPVEADGEAVEPQTDLSAVGSKILSGIERLLSPIATLLTVIVQYYTVRKLSGVA
jgi:hypothetical protein